MLSIGSTVNKAPSDARQRWILRCATGTPALRLFCFCYAGGNASVYLPWQATLGPDIEVCAVQLPGRGARFAEPFLENIESAVPAIAHAIAPLQDRPFAFFGHSLGALLAYEVTHYLRMLGAPMPRHLIVSGAQGPRLRRPRRQFHLLDDAELARELERYAGTPSEVLAVPELVALMLPVLRADFRMALEYVSKPRLPLSLPIAVFAGRDDEFDDVAQYEDWFNDSSMPGELHWFDGGHFFISSASAKVLYRLATILTSGAGSESPYLHAF